MRVAPAAIWQNALPGVATVTALAIAVTAVAFTLPRYTEAWGVVVVGGAVTLFLMNQRALLVPLIILTVPLEISKIFIPILQAENPWGGYSVSLLDLSRLMTMLAIGVWMLDSL
ncbi:MAG: hypothetical protein HY329_20965, partial [Chloroflexi bacterium]|nr:hypothetical protein [Chloroflexota bacterium]